MAYFKKFPSSLYMFANGEEGVMQNLASYVEILDDVKTNGAFYKDYYIRNGDRADNVAFNLYANPRLHWTFYLMNDHLREQGWPLDHVDIVEKAKTDFPHYTVTTEEDIANIFQVGDSVLGYTSNAEGTIVSRNLDLGQLVIKITNNKSFQVGELLKLVGSPNQVVLSGASPEYLAARHYLQNDEIVTNVEDLVDDGTAVEVTNLEFYIRENDKLRQIIVLKPSAVNQVVRLFREAISAQ